MSETIFTKIIRGEIPSCKVYEDDKVYAFLDINPEATGHTLVVPKVPVDKFYDIAEEDYDAVFRAAKLIARKLDEVTGQRVLVKIIGTDVPHAHVHLIPLRDDYDVADPLIEKPTDEEFKEMARKIRDAEV